MAEKKGVIILYKYKALLSKLPLEEQGRILQAALTFDMTGEAETFENPVTDMLFSVMLQDFEAMNEKWEAAVTARSESGKQGAEKRWQNNGKNSKPVSPIANNGKNAINDINNDLNKEKEEEGACAPAFSLSENLNPNRKEISEETADLSAEWNSLDIGAPFTTLLPNLTGYERSDLLKGLQRHTKPEAIQAMRNYKRVLAESDFDPGGCKDYSFISFLIKGVDRYCDEAKPFERFKPKPKTLQFPEQNQCPKEPDRQWYANKRAVDAMKVKNWKINTGG